jgi:hypothetical protein
VDFVVESCASVEVKKTVDGKEVVSWKDVVDFAWSLQADMGSAPENGSFASEYNAYLRLRAKYFAKRTGGEPESVLRGYCDGRWSFVVTPAFADWIGPTLQEDFDDVVELFKMGQDIQTMAGAHA